MCFRCLGPEQSIEETPVRGGLEEEGVKSLPYKAKKDEKKGWPIRSESYRVKEKKETSFPEGGQRFFDAFRKVCISGYDGIGWGKKEERSST